MSHLEAFQTTVLMLCRSSHAEPLQATASERPARGPYVTARVGLEPATFRMEGTEPYH